MKKIFRIFTLLLPGIAIAAMTASSHAGLLFSFATGSIDTGTTDPGFRTESSVVASFPEAGEVAPGTPLVFDFAEVFTPETTVDFEPGDDDDIVPIAASATLTLTAPVATTLNFTGQTVGERVETLDPGNGRIAFDSPQTVEAGGRLFEVALSETTYNDLLALTGPGPDGNFLGGGSGVVTVTVSDVTSVPEPASLAAALWPLVGSLVARRPRAA